MPAEIHMEIEVHFKVVSCVSWEFGKSGVSLHLAF